jgi:hypothetical protein
VVAAAVQFTQGATIGPAGQALFGGTGTAVVVGNGNNTNVINWTFTVIDAPPTSAITPGVKQSGATSTWAFTPDVTDSYLIALTVTDSLGNSATDIRSFTVKRAPIGGFELWIPPFSATAPMLNFGGQTRGWAIAMEGWLNYLYSLTASSGRPEPVEFMFGTTGGNSSTNIPAGSIILAAKGVIGPTPFSGGTTCECGVTGTPAAIFPTGTIDTILTVANEPFSVPIFAVWPGGQVLVTMGGAPAAGTGTMLIDYVPATQP